LVREAGRSYLPATKVFYEYALLKLLFIKYTQIQNNSQVHCAIKKIKNV
jgi:hypothetical protein